MISPPIGDNVWKPRIEQRQRRCAALEGIFLNGFVARKLRYFHILPRVRSHSLAAFLAHRRRAAISALSLTACISALSDVRRTAQPLITKAACSI
jgi:hypothetical protein